MAKSERMHLRFSPEDKALVRQKAEMAGMSVSELVRSILQKRQIRSHGIIAWGPEDEPTYRHPLQYHLG